MTSSGDAPGMNPRVRPIFRVFLGSGLRVKGVRRASERPLAERRLVGGHGVMVGPPSRVIAAIALAEVGTRQRRANLNRNRMARMPAK